MNLFVKDLPPDIQILIAMGSAVAAGCQPCLKQLVRLAKDEALEDARMRAAITIGQFVKDQPAQEMKTLAHELLGGNPASKATEIDCPCHATGNCEATC
jgi:alkylhydroperoxidase/carboxymuconolactone decarboxylase family protein YurZ